MSKYNKLLVAIAGVVVQGIGSYYGANSEWYVLAVALLTAAGVYHVPNVKGATVA